MSCPHVVGCALYPQFSLNTLLRMWQTKYCEGDFKKCARYQLSQDGLSVPLTLLPNGQHLQFRRPR